MGRIADAMNRAEEQRRLAPDRSAPPPFPSPQVYIASAEAPPPLEARPLVEAPLSIETPPSAEAPTPAEAFVPAATRPAVIEGLCDSLVPFVDPASLVTEQYRSLRTRLLSQNPRGDHRIVAITSAVPKEGKSVTTLNLGCVLAEIRHLRILVVDGDFRRGSLAPMLRQPAGPGLADVLAGEAGYEQAIQNTPIPNLKFIGSGHTRERSAAQLLTEARAGPVFKRMQDDFHYTLVDTPPATTVTDVGIIGQMCNGVIVIVRLHRTHEVAARRAVRLLQANHVPILGCLIVGRDPAVDRYGYGYHSTYDSYDHDLKPAEGGT
jgi:capsular exopolysaccharide synthesis family protein